MNNILEKDIKDCEHQLTRTFEIHEDPFWFQKYCYECKKWFFFNPSTKEYKNIKVKFLKYIT